MFIMRGLRGGGEKKKERYGKIWWMWIFFREKIKDNIKGMKEIEEIEREKYEWKKNETEE